MILHLKARAAFIAAGLTLAAFAGARADTTHSSHCGFDCADASWDLRVTPMAA